MDNYLLQMKMAQQRFLTYDQDALIRKCRLKNDARYLYTAMLNTPYRLCRASGSLERFSDHWQDANTFSEVMTVLDVLCDCKEDRCLSGKWQTTQHFGQMFHRGLLEHKEDPLAQHFHAHPGLLEKTCLALGGSELSAADEAYVIPLLDNLQIALHFWAADEEFPAQLRYFWDANALQYIRYETMHYALGLLTDRLAEESLLFL